MHFNFYHFTAFPWFRRQPCLESTLQLSMATRACFRSLEFIYQVNFQSVFTEHVSKPDTFCWRLTSQITGASVPVSDIDCRWFSKSGFDSVYQVCFGSLSIWITVQFQFAKQWGGIHTFFLFERLFVEEWPQVQVVPVRINDFFRDTDIVWSSLQDSRIFLYFLLRVSTSRWFWV